MQSSARKPGKVTLIVILAIVGGILGILGGVGLIGFGVLANAIGSGTTENKDAFVATFYQFGCLTFVLGILSIVFSIGAIKLKTWAWTLGLCLYTPSIVLSVILVIINAFRIGYQPIVILYCAIILFLMLTPDVRLAFGKVKKTSG